MSVDRHNPPYKVAGVILLIVAAAVASLIYLQFRGDLTRTTQLTLLASRAGLVVEPGAKVTFNGVEIGRVGTIGLGRVTRHAEGRASAGCRAALPRTHSGRRQRRHSCHNGVRQQVHIFQLAAKMFADNGFQVTM